MSEVLPTREEFAEYVDACLHRLNRSRAQFLSNGKASGKNRVAVLLASRERMNMVLARQLQLELIEAAGEQGVELPSLGSFQGSET